MNIVLDVSAYQTFDQVDKLLSSAPDQIVGVYIKVTEGLNYRVSEAPGFVDVCKKHNTPFGYYHFLTNDDCSAQAKYMQEYVATLPQASLIPMIDAEPPYNKGLAGVEHFPLNRGIVYASWGNIDQYKTLGLDLWVAQYDKSSYYRPAQSEIDGYAGQGYDLWQWTSAYENLNQDASVVLRDFNRLKV